MTATVNNCSYCNQMSDRLIAGPTVYICFRCATEYTEILKQASPSTLGHKDASPTCSFCGQNEAAGHPVFSGINASICSVCVALTSAIMGKPLNELPRVSRTVN
jgi:ATP-dependent protease Clp ATPase subunit